MSCSDGFDGRCLRLLSFIFLRIMMMTMMMMMMMMMMMVAVPGCAESEPINLRELSKCLTQSAGNSTLERWLGCVESIRAAVRHKQAGHGAAHPPPASQFHRVTVPDDLGSGLPEQNPRTASLNPNLSELLCQPANPHSNSRCKVAVNGKRISDSAHSDAACNQLSDVSCSGIGGLGLEEEFAEFGVSHSKWTLDQTRRKLLSDEAWTMQPQFDPEVYDELLVQKSVPAKDISSEFATYDGEEYHKVQYSRMPDRLESPREFFSNVRLVKIVAILLVIILVGKLLNSTRNTASVKGFSSISKTSSSTGLNQNGIPLKERSNKSKPRSVGLGSIEKQEKGHKEDLEAVFVHLGNAIGILLAELWRFEICLTREVVSAEDLLELLEASLKESTFSDTSGNLHSYLEKFKQSLKRTFIMLNNVHCAHLKLLEKHSHLSMSNDSWRGSTTQGGSCDARNRCHGEAVNEETFPEGFQTNELNADEQYYSCDDATNTQTSSFGVNDQEAESSSRIVSRRVIEKRTTESKDLHSQNPKLPVEESLHFFPTSGQCMLSEVEICDGHKAKNSSNGALGLTEVDWSGLRHIDKDSTFGNIFGQVCRHPGQMTPANNNGISDEGSLKESKLKDLRLVHCTTRKGWRAQKNKNMSCCDVESEASHEHLKTNGFGLDGDIVSVSDVNEAELSLAFEKLTTSEYPSSFHSIRESIAAPSDSLAEGARLPATENEVTDDKLPMHLVQRRPADNGGMLHDARILAGSVFDNGFSVNWRQRQDFLENFERSVDAQVHRNYIKSIELAQAMKRLSLKEQQLRLTSESNYLMGQNLVLNKSRVTFKLWEAFDKKVETEYTNLSRICADELIAGLVVMLVALLYGCWNFSYDSLSEALQSCQRVKATTKENQKWSWFKVDQWYSSLLASISGPVQEIICEVTLFSRRTVGMALIALVASSLFRYSVTGLSQGMPVTILLVVLGGICGFVGKLSVQSLGGNGMYWLLIWKTLCVLHACATCFTPTLYKLLNETQFNQRGKSRVWVPSWIRKLLFHTNLVLVLPVMAGLVPFATFRESIQRTLALPIFDKLARLSQSILRSVS